MTIVAALLMLAHGLAHLVGFVAAWELSAAKVPHMTTVLSGRVDVGEAGIRILGVMWVILALAFVTAAAGALALVPWWPALGLAAAGGSMLLCAVEWPEAKAGVAVNVAVILLILATLVTDWPLAG